MDSLLAAAVARADDRLQELLHTATNPPIQLPDRPPLDRIARNEFQDWYRQLDGEAAHALTDLEAPVLERVLEWLPDLRERLSAFRDDLSSTSVAVGHLRAMCSSAFGAAMGSVSHRDTELDRLFRGIEPIELTRKRARQHAAAARAAESLRRDGEAHGKAARDRAPDLRASVTALVDAIREARERLADAVMVRYSPRIESGGWKPSARCIAEALTADGCPASKTTVAKVMREARSDALRAARDGVKRMASVARRRGGDVACATAARCEVDE